ncbi:DUF6252 family protein [Mesonia sp. MT50]|uniref:DUF6252 family protein n=1 Tax=Mesonia profundi TaxID=3070998 RepID=A0ABU0ZY49_9FLAO|nr:DUF6252 family protein [Mesonia profundi]MDQ7916395.1 DUF6252 family protein [Mesonia profundi]
MKNMNLFKRLFLILTVISLASCDNEPLEGEFESYNPGTNLESNFQVDVDGVTFTADQSQMVTQNGVTSISGIKSNGTSVMISLMGSGTGTYTFGSGIAAGGYAVAGETPYVIDNEDTSAEVVITDYDMQTGVASGTFSYSVVHTVEDENGEDLVETKALTNGIFTNISLTSDEAPTDLNTLFEVELDGDLFANDDVQAVLNEDGLAMQVLVGNEQFVIQIFDPSVGTFTLGSDAGAEGFILYDVDSTNEESAVYSSVSGTLTISSLDMNNNVVAGTFSGALEEALGEGADIAMTNGVFEDVQFSTEESPNMATATIDGEAFEANVFAWASVTGGSSFAIVFDNDLDTDIQLTLPNNVDVGTYSITDSLNDYSAMVTLDAVSYDSVADSGEIDITSAVGGILEGTFNFTAKDNAGNEIVVESGVFVYDNN